MKYNINPIIYLKRVVSEWTKYSKGHSRLIYSIKELLAENEELKNSANTIREETIKEFSKRLHEKEQLIYPFLAIVEDDDIDTVAEELLKEDKLNEW